MIRNVGRLLLRRWNSTATTHAPLTGEGKDGREDHPNKNTSRFSPDPYESTESASRRGRVERVPQQHSMHAHTTGWTVAPRQPTRVGRPENHRGDETTHTAAQSRDDQPGQTARSRENKTSGFFLRTAPERVPGGDERTHRPHRNRRTATPSARRPTADARVGGSTPHPCLLPVWYKEGRKEPSVCTRLVQTGSGGFLRGWFE